jgi:succinate dehydrogenase/fumarate reductase flavoprotein subunit
VCPSLGRGSRLVLTSSGASELDGDVDVIVSGAGMGGLVAGVAALEDGARVLMVEKTAAPGGSLAISGGYVWTFESFTDYKRYVPHGDPVLGRVLVDDFATGIEWLSEHQVRFGEPHNGLGPDRAGSGFRIEPDPVLGAVEPLMQAFVKGGGTLLCSSRMVGLAQDDDGTVVGARIRSSDGTRTVRSRSVVLATGGFQGDAELMARHVSPWADRALLRASPSSTGDGFRLALGAGASTSRGLNAVYAHVMPKLGRTLDPGGFRALTQFYVEECMLLNLDGVRFVDESRGDALCGLELLRQREGAGFIVLDEERHSSTAMQPFVPDMMRSDPLAAVRAAGGTVIVADTLDELCHRLAGHGVPPLVALATIRQFDSAAELGVADGLPVPRARGLHTCRKAPFFAIPVIPGVTFTEGGIRVNAEAQALDRDDRPVPGLFVAGVDVGAISNTGYAGALSAAMITGLRAGLHAARSGTSR